MRQLLRKLRLFTNLKSSCSSYRKEAAEEAWKEMQAWLRKYRVLGPASS